MSKTAFYFRTRKEFEDIYLHIESIAQSAKNDFKFRNHILRVKSRYLGDPKADVNPKTLFIPYNKPTKKKYIGVVVGNKHQMKRADINPVEILNGAGLQVVSHSDNEPKYKGEQSSAKLHLKNYEQFKKLVSMFNKRFGHGEWGIHGPRKLQKKLKLMTDETNSWGEGHRLRGTYSKGIPVKIVINKSGIDVKKYIFKLLLMT